MPDAPRHPIHRAADERSLLVGYVNTATLYVKDGEGAALDLTGVAVTATVDTEQGRALAAVTAEVADAGAGAVALTIAEAEVAKTEGREAYLAVRLDLGAGVVYEGQYPVFGEAGFAAPAEGSDGYVLPDLSLTVTAGEGVDVQAEWLAVRSAATAVATEWEAGASYPAGRIVGYDGQAWRALVATTPGEIPSEASEEWALFVARGEQGETGPPGPQGEPGAAATVAVGTTTTLGPGADATVANSGTSSAAVLDFGIPEGQPGEAATVAVGTTTTGDPGTDAAVANSGTASAAVLDFTIPRGDPGDGVTIVSEDAETITVEFGGAPRVPSAVGQDAGLVVQTDGADGYELAEPASGVPDPSAEDDGLVLTTDGGAAVWAPSAGVTAREVALLGLDRIVAYDTFDVPDGTPVAGRTMPSGQTWATIADTPIPFGSGGANVTGGEVPGTCGFVYPAALTRGGVGVWGYLPASSARSVGVILGHNGVAQGAGHASVAFALRQSSAAEFRALTDDGATSLASVVPPLGLNARRWTRIYATFAGDVLTGYIDGTPVLTYTVTDADLLACLGVAVGFGVGQSGGAVTSFYALAL